MGTLDQDGRAGLIAYRSARGGDARAGGDQAVRTVLIIEDNDDNRIIYAAVLEHFGYRVLEADNGYTGIELARQARPDVVLMDVSMPILDGLEATQALKHDPETAQIPVIVVTAHTMALDHMRALDAGCDAFVGKPVSPLALVEEVARFAPLEVRLAP